MGLVSKVLVISLSQQYFVILSLSVDEISVGKASQIMSFLCPERHMVLYKNSATKVSSSTDISSTETLNITKYTNPWIYPNNGVRKTSDKSNSDKSRLHIFSNAFQKLKFTNSSYDFDRYFYQYQLPTVLQRILTADSIFRGEFLLRTVFKGDQQSRATYNTSNRLDSQPQTDLTWSCVTLNERTTNEKSKMAKTFCYFCNIFHKREQAYLLTVSNDTFVGLHYDLFSRITKTNFLSHISQTCFLFIF